MIPIDEILAMQIDCVARWHREPVDNPYATDGRPASLMAIACQQHQFNYLLWHEEDIARSREVTDAQIASVKRNIDRYNQARNDWIERIDDWITDDLNQKSIESNAQAKLNTETPGSATDRLSIMSLRIYHLDEQLAREDVDEAHREKVNTRLAICRLQHHDLSQSLKELLADIYSSTKRHRTYRQMKMYNDPTLNPYLYNSKKTATTDQ
ncbi:MAG: DUF4254 domain-containing protein [Pirellula sp.]